MTPAETEKLERYLQQRFHSESLKVVAVEGRPAAAVQDGEAFLGIVTRDEDEGEVSYDFVMRIEGEEETLTAWEMARLKEIMSERMNDPHVEIRARPPKKDSAEVYTGDEFLGVLFLDVEDEDGAVSFNMGILDIDLEDMDAA